MCEIIGRKEEIADFQRIYNSGRPEFVAVYGRRRVGKTFLINEVFKDNMVFHHTGLSPYDRKRRVSLKDQLQNFHFTLIRYGLEGIACPKSWLEAFMFLQQLLERIDNGSRQVVFIDELPWMDTGRSGFLTALEAFWNGWGNTRHNLCLIVCGSATSWMLDNLINNKGGLYGRLTWEMKLSPFTLSECEQFYRSRHISMTRYQILQSYMVIGGIPFYMNYFNPSLSLAQNIDKLFFAQKAKLSDEFERLFHSVFDHAENCMKVVRLLGKRHSGFTRNEIAVATGLNPNGDFTKLLKSLENSDIIVKYSPFTSEKKCEYYKLADPFCWFWLHFKEQKQIRETDFWEHHLNEAEIKSWCGIAFEEVCFNHIEQIKKALGIAGVSTTETAYIVKGDEETEGMQMDMLINRRDDVINLCELKYYKDKFSIDKSYAELLRNRKSFIESAFTKKAVHLTLITTYGLVQNAYAHEIPSQLTMDKLFEN